MRYSKILLLTFAVTLYMLYAVELYSYMYGLQYALHNRCR